MSATNSMGDFRKKPGHYNSTAGVGVLGNGSFGKAPLYGHNNAARRPPTVQLDPMHRRQHKPYPQHDHSIAALTQDIGKMNLQASSFAANQRPSSQLSTVSSDFGGVALNTPIGQPFLYNGHVVYTGIGQGQACLPQQTAGMYSAAGPQYLNPATYGSYPGQAYSTSNSFTPSWPSTRVPSSEAPTLVTPRRDSSSDDEHAAPGTPFNQYQPFGDFNNVAVMGRSPNSMYSWSTPSPSLPAYATNKSPVVSGTLSPKVLNLLNQDPVIPPAVPAPHSPKKPLDRALENPHGVTNVYIRGLQPNIDDDALKSLAARFGDIVSHKSIIDHATKLCKGFGFVKFHNYDDAQDCIRGFHYMGYETSFARESFYSQLKKLADDDNTNLYVSNLPKDMNEHELGALFSPHKVCSSRILRDAAGNGRGVGFARFETKEICEQIISTFNNSPITSDKASEEYTIQIRYADTPDQKHLKQQTTAARQYRSAEYDSQIQGRFYTPQRGNNFASSLNINEQDFSSYMAGPVNVSTAASYPHPANGSELARDRLHNVSSHLSPIPGHTVVNVNLPAATKSDRDARHSSVETDEDVSFVTAESLTLNDNKSQSTGTVKGHD